MYNVQLTTPRPPISELDNLPIPDRSLVDYEKYHSYVGDGMVRNIMSLQATRGCPYHCLYCHKIWPKKHFVRSAEHILEEIRLYYDMGVKKFSFVDDIFNLNIKNSMRFFELIIKEGMDMKLFYPNGFRGDVLTEEFIDLMVKAGTVKIGLALETASPRLQKLLRKNLNLEKFRENIEYICRNHPQVILDLFSMHGFPTETEEEAMMTVNFIKSLEWVHFPYINIVKIFPKTELEKVAVENGISRQDILRSKDLPFYELPYTLPFSREFTLHYKTEFVQSYFLAKERLLHVLPYQMKVLTRDELVRYYDSYLNIDVKTFEEFLDFIGIEESQLNLEDVPEGDNTRVPDLNRQIRKAFPAKEPDAEGLSILLLDMTQRFSSDEYAHRDLVEAPLGLMYLLTYLRKQFGAKVKGKILKSRIDFDDFDRLEVLFNEYDPEVVGIRTLTLQAALFHEVAELIRKWGFTGPLVAGGPYATSDYETILQDPNVDLVVMGEGEVTFAEVISRIMKTNGECPPDDILAGIQGIAYVPGRSARRSRDNQEETQVQAQFFDDLEDE